MLMNTNAKQGVLLAIAAYLMWGIIPAYFKLLNSMVPTEILMHRIIWSSLLLMIIISVKKNWSQISSILKKPKTLLILIASASILAFNWWLFIWAINNNHLLDASLGYYINPLLNVALGMFFLGERLSKLQYAAVGLAFVGVTIQVVTFGSFPVVAFALAISFSVYGLIRKTVSVDSVSGLLMESLLLTIPAVLYWWFMVPTDASNMANNTIGFNLLIMAAGLITTAPLLCFVAAARRLNYSTMGFFQYIGPSIMFMFAVFIYGEKVGEDRWVTFGFIWTALIIYSVASILKMKKDRKSNKAIS
ncbi:EamA family transporter RarD [Psychrosphaera saromensis]|uniref:EamA family transporter n=1 Tax=Psychrosphaera saromensis TaxID=716813 RepID=A0A2S7UU08_9GAMM|nr:EamA family transporter RarD [Psychrosphaera saromensis]PQJ52760.1 EamA family transporter [Psychrosphaera saromensis]